MSTDVNEALMLEAFGARLERVLRSAGYRTDAGSKIVLQRRPAPDSDGDLLIAAVHTQTTFESIGTSPRYTISNSEFEIGGHIAAEVESQIQTTDLLLDIRQAAMDPIENDVIHRYADTITPVSSFIYLAEPGEDYTVVVFKLIVRWCDPDMEQFT